MFYTAIAKGYPALLLIWGFNVGTTYRRSGMMIARTEVSDDQVLGVRVLGICICWCSGS
jgi:hypothetical protein